MTFRELFHIRKSDQKIRLDDNWEGEKIESEESFDDEPINEFVRNTSNEWHQEYELIYLSYILER